MRRRRFSTLRGVRSSAVLLAILSSASCATIGHLSGRQTRVFVSNYRDDSVSVIDADDARELKVIPVPASPYGLAARSRDPLVAVANSSGSTVTLIDPARLEVLHSIEVGPIPEHPVFSVDGRTLFVSLPKEKRVAMVDVAAGRALEPIDLGLKPKRLAVSPDGQRLYVLLHVDEGAVAVVDIATRAVVAKIPVGKFPTDFGLSKDGRRLVAASYDDDTITVIDTATLKPVATHDVSTGLGLIVHPTKPIAYSMASFDDVVTVVNYETGQQIAELNVGKWPTYSAITSDGRFVWITCEDGNNVVKLDTETNQVVTRVGAGDQPQNAVVVELR